MASNYPTSLDSFSNPSGTDSLNSPSHSLQHADINDAVEALETKIGIGNSPAGSATAGQVLTAQGGGTAIWATPALVHINTTSFSAVATQSINNVFSADYRNYKIIYDAVHNSSSDIRLRYRASGSDNSTANYTQQGLSAATTAVTGFRLASQTIGHLSGTAGISRAEIIVMAPNLSLATSYIANIFSGDADIRIVASNFGLTTVFDGFSIFPNTGTITGQISVYGLKD